MRREPEHKRPKARLRLHRLKAAATGKGLWYSQIGGLSSPPETFMLDGKQHMLFTGANGLYLFVLN